MIIRIFLFVIFISLMNINVHAQLFNKNASRKAERKQEAHDKQLKSNYVKSVKQSQKKTIDIQTPEVQARMKQNQKDAAIRDRAKKNKVKTSTRKAGKKYN
ncbi:MAG: hypothetical protein EPN88_01685 [Bacteroidetes bacterium]|nr:MAG: hypothetical protein EPN88_01685 [Bacteroidota bacterium]